MFCRNKGNFRHNVNWCLGQMIKINYHGGDLQIENLQYPKKKKKKKKKERKKT